MSVHQRLAKMEQLVLIMSIDIFAPVPQDILTYIAKVKPSLYCSDYLCQPYNDYMSKITVIYIGV